MEQGSLPTLRRKLFWLTAWGVCFGYIDVAVVVSLRRLYYPLGFSFPLVPMEVDVAVVELVREAVTLLFMWAVAELSFRRLQDKLAAYMILFGTWDILYYFFLKAFLDWPRSLSELDILFLLPLPWVGPVWAPILVSLCLITAGTVILIRQDAGSPLAPGWRFWLLEAACGAAIVLSFLIPGQAVLAYEAPGAYPWYLFWPALVTGAGAFGMQLKRSQEPGPRSREAEGEEGSCLCEACVSESEEPVGSGE